MIHEDQEEFVEWLKEKGLFRPDESKPVVAAMREVWVAGKGDLKKLEWKIDWLRRSRKEAYHQPEIGI